MAKKVLQNRISKEAPLNAEADLLQAAVIIRRVLGAPIAISEADYKSLRKVGPKLKQEADAIYELARSNPEMTEAPFEFAEMTKDKGAGELCALVKKILAPLLLQAEREQTIAEAEYLNGCSLFEEHVALKSERGHAKAQHIQVQLNRIDRNRSGGTRKAKVKKDAA